VSSLCFYRVFTRTFSNKLNELSPKEILLEAHATVLCFRTSSSKVTQRKWARFENRRENFGKFPPLKREVRKVATYG